MERKELKASYELAKTYEGLRKSLLTAERRAARLEKLEVVLRMWAANTDERNGSTEYARAQEDVLGILGEASYGLMPKYNELIAEFEKEIENEKAQEGKR